MYILFNEKAVCESRKKFYLGLLDSKMVIAMPALNLNGEARDNVSTDQRTQTKEDQKGFLGLSCDCPWAPEWTRPFSKEDNNLFEKTL